MLTGAGRTATWTSFNMPATIALGGTELRWLYGPERQRMRETLTGTANTLQVDGFAGARFERRQQVSNGVITTTSFLVFGGEMVALETVTSTTPTVSTTLWQLKDHLGSSTTLLNTSGQLSEPRKGYDVWGKRRHVTGADDASNTIASASNRDFTGHEYLEEIRLVHMNGRIYDPVVGRFLSPDPFIDNPLDLQSLNRYSYVNNNPLAYTDPSGYFKIGKFFGAIARAVFGGIYSFLPREIRQIVRPLLIAGATFLGGPQAGIFVAIYTGAIDGAISGGLKGAIFGAVTSGASAVITLGIGGLDLGFAANSVADIVSKSVLHGVAQGALAAAQGGEFGPAFLAGSFAHAVGGAMKASDFLQGEGFGLLAARTASAAIIGGTAAVIGGGKFANGAITGAFVHLFNQESSAAARGRAAHEAFKIIARGEGMESEGYFEVGIFGYVKLDALERQLGVFWELKPYTASGVLAALRDVKFYQLMTGLTPGGDLGSFRVGDTRTGSFGGYYFEFRNHGMGIFTHTEVNGQPAQSAVDRLGRALIGASPQFGPPTRYKPR
jgi:RHS repeat-associated protein